MQYLYIDSQFYLESTTGHVDHFGDLMRSLLSVCCPSGRQFHGLQEELHTSRALSPGRIKRFGSLKSSLESLELAPTVTSPESIHTQNKKTSYKENKN